MGLDTTHGCWHGSYTFFSRWRAVIALRAGFPTKQDEGALEVDFDHGMFHDWSVVFGEWGDKQPDDVLMVLLNHSDCEGKIPARFCAPLADRLEGLLPALENETPFGYSDRELTQKFIDGLRLAASQGEDVEFH